jgi:hypothetical protein
LIDFEKSTAFTQFSTTASIIVSNIQTNAPPTAQISAVAIVLPIIGGIALIAFIFGIILFWRSYTKVSQLK